MSIFAFSGETSFSQGLLVYGWTRESLSISFDLTLKLPHYDPELRAHL
jgi:hypothetical protein